MFKNVYKPKHGNIIKTLYFHFKYLDLKTVYKVLKYGIDLHTICIQLLPSSDCFCETLIGLMTL